ncbi:uncharacterized protein [Dendrobates tinctorius]|uniref:uncharacterized protein n=1 Tax=Dendrobates tinctorius TaxID=92724 RepID=UPI003CC98376
MNTVPVTAEPPTPEPPESPPFSSRHRRAVYTGAAGISSVLLPSPPSRLHRSRRNLLRSPPVTAEPSTLEPPESPPFSRHRRAVYTGAAGISSILLPSPPSRLHRSRRNLLHSPPVTAEPSTPEPPESPPFSSRHRRAVYTEAAGISSILLPSPPSRLHRSRRNLLHSPPVTAEPSTPEPPESPPFSSRHRRAVYTGAAGISSILLPSPPSRLHRSRRNLLHSPPVTAEPSTPEPPESPPFSSRHRRAVYTGAAGISFILLPSPPSRLHRSRRNLLHSPPVTAEPSTPEPPESPPFSSLHRRAVYTGAAGISSILLLSPPSRLHRSRRNLLPSPPSRLHRSRRNLLHSPPVTAEPSTSEPPESPSFSSRHRRAVYTGAAGISSILLPSPPSRLHRSRRNLLHSPPVTAEPPTPEPPESPPFSSRHRRAVYTGAAGISSILLPSPPSRLHRSRRNLLHSPPVTAEPSTPEPPESPPFSSSHRRAVYTGAAGISSILLPSPPSRLHRSRRNLLHSPPVTAEPSTSEPPESPPFSSRHRRAVYTGAAGISSILLPSPPSRLHRSRRNLLHSPPVTAEPSTPEPPESHRRQNKEEESAALRGGGGAQVTSSQFLHNFSPEPRPLVT